VFSRQIEKVSTVVFWEGSSVYGKTCAKRILDEAGDDNDDMVDFQCPSFRPMTI
jgi:hypothetical protein